MVYRTGVSETTEERRRVPLLQAALAALLCACFVAANLAGIAAPAAAEALATTTGNSPLTVSGTISYSFSYSVPGPCPSCRTSESLNVTMTVASKAVGTSPGNSASNWDNPDVYRCALAARAGGKCFWAPLAVESATVRYDFAAQVAVPLGCDARASATGTKKAVSTALPLGLDVVFNPAGASGARGPQVGAAPVPVFGPAGLPPSHGYRASGNIAVEMALTYVNKAAALACGMQLPTNTWDLPIAFEGSYRPGNTTIRGSATYSGLGPPKLTWDLALKPTGLAITSPAASSTIALTDGNYLSPQPGPDQSAPESRELTVKGTDTSPGASVVRIGALSTPVARDGSWSLRVPVAGPRTMTVRVEDNAGATADERITLIDLVISSPTEGAVLPITSVPAMPALGAVASLEDYPGNAAAVTFNWSLSMRGEYRDRCGHNPDASCGQWYAYDNNVASGTTTGRALWEGDFTTVEGGFGRMSVSAIVPGVLDEPVQSEPRWLDIPGTNPSISAIKAYVSAQDPSNAPVEDELFCHESRFVQFNPSPEPREPATTTVPHDIGENPATLRPLFGAQYAGIGIAQKDPSSFPLQQWDWHANVDSGIAVYHEDLAVAKQWRQAEQVRLSGQLTAVLQIVNRQRALRGMKRLVKAPLRIPSLTTAQIEREAIRGYNGENEYHFNLQYVVSSNHLMVKTVGTGKWVEGAGEWQALATWQSAGGPLMARQWIPAQDPGYVTLVKACHL